MKVNLQQKIVGTLFGTLIVFGTIPIPSPSPTPSGSPPPSSTLAPRPTRSLTPTPGPVFSIPASIAGDCSRDVSTEIANWVSSVPDNATLLFGQNACYRAETFIRFDNRNALTLDWNGSTLRRTQLSPRALQYPAANPHLQFVGGSRITVMNLHITGTNTTSDTGMIGFGGYLTTYEFEHGILLSGVRGATIQDVSIDAVWGDGIYLAPRQGASTTNALITRVIIDRNGRQGVGIVGAHDTIVDGVQIFHSRRSGIDLEPNPGNVVDNVEIRNSSLNSRLLAFPSGGSSQVSHIYIHDNTINNTGVPWVYVNASDGTRRHDWRIWDNRVLHDLGSPVAGMLFVNIDNVDVRRNTVPFASGRNMTAIEFRNAGGQLSIIGNTFTNACRLYSTDALTTPVATSANVFGCP